MNVLARLLRGTDGFEPLKRDGKKPQQTLQVIPEAGIGHLGLWIVDYELNEARL